MFRIERIGPDARAHGTDQPVCHLRYLAILTVTASHGVGRGDESGPYRRRGALRDRLPLEGRPPAARQLGIDLRHELVKFVGLHMPAEFSFDPARMQRRCPYAAR